MLYHNILTRPGFEQAIINDRCKQCEMSTFIMKTWKMYFHGMASTWTLS